MKFLLDANMPRSALRALIARGHDASHVRDVGKGDSTDEDVAAYARLVNAVIVTRDLDFADVRAYPPADYPGILVLRVPDDWIAQRIVELLESFLDIADFVAVLPQRLAILEPGQCRFRPGIE